MKTTDKNNRRKVKKLNPELKKLINKLVRDYKDFYRGWNEAAMHCLSLGEEIDKKILKYRDILLLLLAIKDGIINETTIELIRSIDVTDSCYPPELREELDYIVKLLRSF